MDDRLVRNLSERYGISEEEARAKLRPPSKEQKAERFQDRSLELKTWHPPASNPEWSHDHCSICNCEISNVSKAEKGYTDDGTDWICKECYTEYLA